MPVVAMVMDKELKETRFWREQAEPTHVYKNQGYKKILPQKDFLHVDQVYFLTLFFQNLFSWWFIPEYLISFHCMTWSDRVVPESILEGVLSLQIRSYFFHPGFFSHCNVCTPHGHSVGAQLWPLVKQHQYEHSVGCHHYPWSIFFRLVQSLCLVGAYH